ncbi:plasmalemma vesicle associated protein a isoform X2 [Gasterosteus aculeatus]
MYSSGYSQVFKSSPQAQKKAVYRSKGKSCGYYMRIVFFFSSLIQSLIIVSLVLFLVYGKKQDSASPLRIHDLEESFSRLSIENEALKQQRKNLTNLLNTTLTEKSRNDWDLNKLRILTNISAHLIQDRELKLQEFFQKWQNCERTKLPFQPPRITHPCNCDLMIQTLKTRITLLEANFTQTSLRMRDQLDQTAKERDTINLEVIHLRREKFTHEKEMEFFKQKCKEDFSQLLSGISEVSKALLEKIDSLFPSHIAFQLTCPKQREHLEQIRTNCSSLSNEVEDKLQRYLDVVGGKMSDIQAENSHLNAENLRLSEDYRWCSNNRTGLILQNRQNIDKLQQKHDEDKEKLLVDKMRLNEKFELEMLTVQYKSKLIDELTERIKQLNVSCATTPGFGFPGGPTGTQAKTESGWGLGGTNSGSASSSSGGQLGRSGSGGLSSGLGSSTGSTFNKPVSTGLGSSTGSAFNKPASTGLGSSTGSAFNKPASTGLGSSTGSAFNKPASTGLGSSTGSAFNKPASTGLGSSTGSAFNKPASTGLGSSTGSTFNKPASTGLGSSIGSAFNKPASTGLGSSTGSAFNTPASTGLGSSSGSAFNRPVSTGFGSSTGSNFNKPASTGLGSSIGSAFNRPVSTGFGSSTGSDFNKPVSTGLGSSTGSTFNKPASTGLGSSIGSAFNRPVSTGFGSSTGSDFNKPVSTGLGSSTGSSFNNPVSTGAGSSSSSTGSGSSGSIFNKPASTGGFFSIFGSAGLDPQNSGGTGSNKPALSGKGSSSFGSPSTSSGIGSNQPTSSHGSSSGSTGSTNKSGPTNSGYSWFLNSNSGQSKTESGTGRGSSTGNSGGSRSSFDTGRLGSTTVEQHLRDLQRIINPSGPEDKQDLSRMLG